MILVVDASSLIALARIGRLDLLQLLATRVLATPRVHAEVVGDPTRPGAAAVAGAAWLEVVSLADPSGARDLAHAYQIALGEAQTIALALERAGSEAVLDENRARAAARAQGCPYTGTLSLILRAKEAGLVPSVAPMIESLASAGFHMAPALRLRVLRKAGEQ